MEPPTVPFGIDSIFRRYLVLFRTPMRLALALASLLVCAASARAEEPRVAALSWVRMPGADGCAGLREIAAAVEQRLGRRVFVAPTDAELFVSGRVSPRAGGSGFDAIVSMADAGGEDLGTRELSEETTDCRALDASIALVVSAMIDPEAALRAEATPATEPAAEEAPAPMAGSLETPAPECRPAPGEATAPVRVGAWLTGVASLGLLPDVALGAGVRLSVTPPGFVAIEAAATVFRTAPADLHDGAGADLSLALGELALCPEPWASGAAGLRTCGGVQVGAMGSRGYGFDRSLDADGIVVNAVAEARLGVRIAGPLSLGVAVQGGAPLVRRRFEAREATGEIREVFRMAPVFGALEIALGGDFF